MPRLRAWFKKEVAIFSANLSLTGRTGESPTVSETTDGTPDLAEGYTNRGNVVTSFSYMWSMLCHRWQSHKYLRGVQARPVLHGMLCANLNVTSNFTVAT